MTPPTNSPRGHTFIGVVVEEVSGLLCFRASLLVAKDEVNPVVQLTGDILTLLVVVDRHWQREVEPY